MRPGPSFGLARVLRNSTKLRPSPCQPLSNTGERLRQLSWAGPQAERNYCAFFQYLRLCLGQQTLSLHRKFRIFQLLPRTCWAKRQAWYF